MKDTKQWRRTDRHGYPSCDMCHEAADIIDALRAERDALMAALEDALCIFAFGDDDKTVLAPKWVARAKAAIAKAQEQTP